MSKALCLRPLLDFADLGVALPQGLEVIESTPDAPDLKEQTARAKALVIPAVGPVLPLALFDESAIRLVQVTGAGVDRVDGAGLRRLGIDLANVPGGSAQAVAEYVIAAASMLLRFAPQSTQAIFQGDYAAMRPDMIARGLNQLSGCVLGIVGYGVIGRTVATQAKALGAEVIFHDPMVRGSIGIDVLFERADIVSLHLPLNDQTRGLVNAALIARMHPNAILINAARGGIVEEAALAEVLEEGRLAGAAIDVYSSEPPDAKNPLLNLSPSARHRVILTPHIAGVTRQSWQTLFRAAWANVSQVLLEGKAPQNVVN